MVEDRVGRADAVGTMDGLLLGLDEGAVGSYPRQAQHASNTDFEKLSNMLSFRATHQPVPSPI